MKWDVGLNDFTTPRMYFHLFPFHDDGRRGHAINSGRTVSKGPNLFKSHLLHFLRFATFNFPVIYLQR